MPDTTPELRCVCGDPVEHWTGPGEAGWIHSPGSDTRCLNARPRCPHCGLPHDLTPGSAPVRLCERARSPEWQAAVAAGQARRDTAIDTPQHATTPAPVDPALAQRVAAALYQHEWPKAGPWADALAMDHEAFLALAAVVLAELAPELARAEEAEAEVRRMRYFVASCGEDGHAVRTAATALQRADKAETALTRVRELHHRYRSPLADHDTCAHCNRITGDLVPWPCDTIRALTGPAEENTP